LDADLITAIIARVFPSGSELFWQADTIEHKNRFWIIPGREGPRWIIPHDAICGWPVLNQWRPYGLSSRLKWAALMAAYRSGQLGLVPGVVGIGVAWNKNWDHLGWIDEKSPVPVIYIGTPGPARKAVAHLVDTSTRKPVAVAKVPLSTLATKNILHEADILQLLKEEKPGIAPTIQSVNRAIGVSLQNFIDGQSSSRTPTQSHIDWLAGLSRPGTETSLREQMETLGKLLSRSEGLEDKRRHWLERILERLDDPTPLPAFWVHGDFAPWNLRWVDEEKLVAVDWEEARQTGLPGTDLIYFFVIQDFLFSRNTPDKTWRRIRGFLQSALVRSYMEKFRHAEKIVASLVLFTFVALLIRRSLTVNLASDRFCRFLQDSIQEEIGNS
jgi:thiamine kinase-like enzyme